MRQKYLEIIKIGLLTMIIMIIVANSPFIFAEQVKQFEVMFIVGNREDQSPISNVEFEFYEQQSNGNKGKLVGRFISQKDKMGDGHFVANMKTGDYLYRVVTPDFQLDNKVEWEKLHLEKEDTVVLLWVNVANKDEENSSDEEISIEDEEVALGQPKVSKDEDSTDQTIKNETEVTFSKNRKIDELQSGAKGNHEGMNTGIFKALNISENSWWTLGVLAGLIGAIFGIDYLNRKYQ